MRHQLSFSGHMLARLTKATRIKTALVLAVLYALCVLTPSTALAFMDSAQAAHCLTKMQGAAPAHVEKAQSHTHADGAAHSHDQQDTAQKSADPDGKAPPEQCCGLFCITALAVEPELTLGRSVAFSTVYPPLTNILGGRGPDRIIRPPIA